MMVPLDPMGPPVVNGGGAGGGGTNGGAGDASGTANSYGIATISTNASFRRRDDEYRSKIMGSKYPFHLFSFCLGHCLPMRMQMFRPFRAESGAFLLLIPACTNVGWGFFLFILFCYIRINQSNGAELW
uniref:Uncharacterized protein n=1 Tax=Anopheles culicifacies TaxID=139723 RepID=A0A182M371_9DIPT